MRCTVAATSLSVVGVVVIPCSLLGLATLVCGPQCPRDEHRARGDYPGSASASAVV
jgi:hypothetical protein